MKLAVKVAVVIGLAFAVFAWKHWPIPEDVRAEKPSLKRWIEVRGQNGVFVVLVDGCEYVGIYSGGITHKEKCTNHVQADLRTMIYGR